MFDVINNMTILDYITSYFRHYGFYYGVFKRYNKTYKNGLSVLYKSFKNDFPFTANLKDGTKKKFYCRFDVGATSAGFKDMYDIENGVITIKKTNFENVRFYNALDNGDIASCFFSEEYDSLQVKDQIVIDVGANIGDSAIYFALRGAKKVIAIEPFPLNYDTAKMNVKKNNLEEIIELINAGCSNKKGFVTINATKEGPASSLTNSETGIQIPLISLSDILEKYRIRSAILKMDCEGCEYDSILDLPKAVLEKFTHISIEYHYGYKNLKEKLDEAGFSVKITPPVFSNSPDNKHAKTYVGYLYAQQN